MTEAHKLLLTSKYMFDYSKGLFDKDNMRAFIQVQDSVRVLCGLPDMTDEEVNAFWQDQEVISESETVRQYNRLDSAFFEKQIYEQVLEEFILYERYDILAGMQKPLCEQGLEIQLEFEGLID